jgi:hypothetical protein
VCATSKPWRFRRLGHRVRRPQRPDWFRNLRKAKVADVQIGAETLQVRPRELLAEERDATWKNVVLAQAPEVEKLAQRAGRTIPVALLQQAEASPRCGKD